jgi:four helix bundle protein
VSRLNEAKLLQNRTKTFAVRIIKAFARLPKDEAVRVIGRQFLRSGTSLAANYRAACRSRSAADFISKISVVVEETDETLFCFELLVEAELAKRNFGRAADERMSGTAQDLFRVARDRQAKSLNH